MCFWGERKLISDGAHKHQLQSLLLVCSWEEQEFNCNRNQVQVNPEGHRFCRAAKVSRHKGSTGSGKTHVLYQGTTLVGPYRRRKILGL